MTAFQLTTTPDDGADLRITVRGELDLANAPELERELHGLLTAGGAGDLVLDLREVTFIDSSGLRAVLVGSREARAAGRRMLVCPGEGQVLRVIELAQVAEHLELGTADSGSGAQAATLRPSSCSCMRSSDWRSRRETCICDIPTRRAISRCGRSSK